MKKMKIPDQHTAHVNVVPMVDVIMCLIIFYMLAAKIGVDTGEDEKIQIPFASWSKEIKDMGASLLINVSDVDREPGTGKVRGKLPKPLITGKVDIASPRQDLVLEDEKRPNGLVYALTRLRFGKDMKPGGGGENADNPDIKLVIRGDKDMSYDTLQKVLMDASRARVKSLNFQTSTVQAPE